MTAIVKKHKRFSLSALLLLLLAGFTAVGGKSVKPGEWLIAKSGEVGLVLDALDMSGNTRTDRMQILSKLDFDLGVPIFAIDLGRAQADIEALPWVKKAEIERVLPNRLTINIREREPFALWQINGEVHLIDSEGMPIDNQPLDTFADFPLLVGVGANQSAGHLLEILDNFPVLADQMKTAVRVGDRRWDLIFEGGVRVKFPEEASPREFQGLMATFMKLESQHRLLERDVSVIDLRVPGRLVMRVNPDARHLVNGDFERT